MIYLDNAATTLMKPETVYQAVTDAMRVCAGVGRSGHAAAMMAAQTVYECRKAAAQLFDTEPDRVVFTFHATHGLNIAIRTLVKPGDRVVVSGFEHNAVMRPLHAIGAEIVTTKSGLFQQDLLLQEFEDALRRPAKAVICTHVSNVFGYVLPIEKISDLCRRAGVPLIVDAAQSAGSLPISLRRLSAAFIAMPGHKGLYGPQGTGILLCGQLPDSLIFGGTGSLSQSAEMPSFLPDRAEPGTHNVPGISGLLRGIEYVRKRGIHQILNHEKALMELLQSKLSRQPHIRSFFGKEQAGVVSLQIKGVDCEDAAQCLAEHDIAVRAGLHCAPAAHKTAGTLTDGTVRISFSDFNTEEDVLRLTDLLDNWNK